MALCNNTKSQSACMDKMSPFLLLDTAAADQAVLRKSTRFFMAISPPLHDSVNTHGPKCPALSCSLKLKPSLLPYFILGLALPSL